MDIVIELRYVSFEIITIRVTFSKLYRGLERGLIEFRVGENWVYGGGLAGACYCAFEDPMSSFTSSSSASDFSFSSSLSLFKS